MNDALTVTVEAAWWDASTGLKHGLTFQVARSFALVLDTHPDASMAFTNALTDCGLPTGPGETEVSPNGLTVVPDCLPCQAVRVARRAAPTLEAGS